jgi:hypothetical protein
MSNALTNPLQALIQQAAKQTPATTGETERYRQRYASAGERIILVCDTSGSMAESAGAKRKIDHLHEALDAVIEGMSHPGPVPVLIAFDSVAREIGSPSALPAPSGGTALHLALRAAAGHRPRQTLVISDGRPDSETEALVAAAALPGRIDVVYCGPDTDTQAIAFMRRLAGVGCGRVIVHDIRRHAAAGAPLLASSVRKLLALPAGDAP